MKFSYFWRSLPMFAIALGIAASAVAMVVWRDACEPVVAFLIRHSGRRHLVTYEPWMYWAPVSLLVFAASFTGATTAHMLATKSAVEARIDRYLEKRSPTQAVVDRELE